MRPSALVYGLVGCLAGLAAATQLPALAQKEAASRAEERATPPPGPTTTREGRQVSIQEALLRPFDFKYGRGLSLPDLAQRLSRDLGAPVVLDLSALERLEIEPDTQVSLELHGVRLKTGLKLLLDQARMTYRVVPEDNLLILTDKQGSEDPVERMSAELRELHRDVHDLQDAVDEVRDLLGAEGQEGARVRKPTIIEELPENGEPKPPRGSPGKEPRLDAAPRPSETPATRPRTRL